MINRYFGFSRSNIKTKQKKIGIFGFGISLFGTSIAIPKLIFFGLIRSVLVKTVPCDTHNRKYIYFLISCYNFFSCKGMLFNVLN